MSQGAPTAHNAALVVRRALGVAAPTIARFPAGSGHYVYDVGPDDGQSVVVRLGRIGQGADFSSTAYWYRPPHHDTG